MKRHELARLPLPWFTLVPATLALLMLACGGGDDGGDDGGETCGEGGPAPAECEIEDAPASFDYPVGPYGTEVGETFENFELEDCDGNLVNFGDILNSAELVFFNVGAGWCIPCVEETATLDCGVFEPFCGRGLRVVQVLFQKDDGTAATKLFCDEWRTEHGLRFPVLVDPIFDSTLEPNSVERYFNDVQAQTPLSLLIDSDGVIQFKETGEPSGDLPSRIDALLP